MINSFLIRVILWKTKKQKQTNKKPPIIYKATGVKIVVWGLGGQASEFEKQS